MVLSDGVRGTGHAGHAGHCGETALEIVAARSVRGRVRSCEMQPLT